MRVNIHIKFKPVQMGVLAAKPVYIQQSTCIRINKNRISAADVSYFFIENKIADIIVVNVCASVMCSVLISKPASACRLVSDLNYYHRFHTGLFLHAHHYSPVPPGLAPGNPGNIEFQGKLFRSEIA